MTVQTSYAEYVVKDRECCRGTARIKYMGIPVAVIVHMHKEGDALEDIVAAYHGLTLEIVHAALNYYKLNKEEINRDIAHLITRK